MRATFVLITTVGVTVALLGTVHAQRGPLPSPMIKEGITEHRVTDHGNAWALYFKDPEGNPVELYVDSPFYTPQPWGEPLDLDQPNDEILRRTETMRRGRPRFMTREAWMNQIQERLDARA